MYNKKMLPLLLLPFLIITALLLLAIWNVALQSLGIIPAFGLTEPTLRYYLDILTQPEFSAAMLVSLRIALLSAVLASIFGVLLCFALIQSAKRNSPLYYLIRLPILTPHAVVAVFAVNLLSQTGLIARLCFAFGLIDDYAQFPQLLYTSSYTGAILAYLWKEIPFVAYFVLALMASVRSTLGEAAQNLGASAVRSFFSITLPLSLPAILKAFLIIFIFAFGGYELPFLLGSTLPKALPVQAYLTYQSPDLLDRPYAMAMNGIILLLSCAMALVYALLTHRLAKKLGGNVHV